MKIQYLSCHSVLEYDEVSLLTELGFDVSANGSYRDPRGAYTLPRPGIKNAKLDKDFLELTALHPKTKLPSSLIDPFDVFIIMAGENESILVSNWDRIKHKRVIWRSIGQNTPQTELMLQKYVAEGLEIIRYSPKEFDYDNFAGSDALIRFYKDPEVFKDWSGHKHNVINFSQSLKGRGAFTHYDQVMGSMAGFNSTIYGSGNNDLGSFNGGEIPFEKMLEKMRESRVYVYGGTWPACYTLTIIEAMMVGMPVVAISKTMAHLPQYQQFDFYEVDEIIEDGVDGFICDSVQEMRVKIKMLLEDRQLANKISKNARKKAIETWGKEKIAKQWEELLKGGKNAS